MINGSADGGDETAEKLRRAAARASDSVEKKVVRLTLELLIKVKHGKLSGPGEGQALNVRTGRLRRSITQRVTVGSSTIHGTVGTNVEYAKFHEYGQSIKADLKKKRESFKAELVARKSTLNPDDLPPRSFLRSALKEMEPRVLEEFANAVRENSHTWRLL